MNSINIGTATAGSSLALFKYNNRSLSASRHSIASRVSNNRSHHSSTANMAAAAIVAQQSGKAGQDNDNDHHPRIAKGNDPVALRTCTVDESFRRMEELVGSEEEEKNWKGIVIALVVIGAILGLIATAIVIVTPGILGAPEKYDPGEPFLFSSLTDENMLLKRPAFNWVKGSDSYVVYEEKEINSTDNFVKKYVSLVQADHNVPDQILLPHQIVSSKLRGLETVEASPNTNYALVKLNTESNSVSSKSTYLIYDNPSSVLVSVVDGDPKLQFATWVGSDQALVYVEDNNIKFKPSVESAADDVTTDGADNVLNGVPDKLYKMFIMPKRDSLIWPSADGDTFVYAKINIEEETSYSDPSGSTPTLPHNTFTPSKVTLHSYQSKTTKAVSLPNTDGYLTSVSWMDSDRIMVVWLSLDHQTESYIICSLSADTCDKNYEYTANGVDIHWVGLYTTPVYNPDKDEYYTILPDPANENRLFRHIAAIKVSGRSGPDVTYITSDAWSDRELLGLRGSTLYYLSSGLNVTHQHLYSVDVETKESTCMTCEELSYAGNVTYVDAEFSDSLNYVYLSVLGPNLPSYHVLKTNNVTENVTHVAGKHTQIDKDYYLKLNATYAEIRLPIVEYLTVPLDNGEEASVKLILPSIFNREKICLYETIIVINNMPGTQMVTQEYTLGFHEYLAKNQTYIIAFVDLRGSTGRGEKLHQSVNGNLGVAEAADIDKVIRFLSENSETYKVNKDFIAVLGQGYGGFVSLHSVARGSIKCGIITSPLTDLHKYAGWMMSRYMRGAAGETDLTYECTETTTLCSTPPHNSSMVIIHGTDDAVFPVDNSLTIMRQLQISDYDFRQQLYPQIGHDIEASDIRSHYYQTISHYLNECFQIQQRADDSKLDYCSNREG